MRLLRVAATSLLCAFLTATWGCGVKEYVNCTDLCNKKKECGTDSNYDVQSCVSSCSDQANKDNDYARKVDTCKECLSGLSCMDYKNTIGCLVKCPKLP